jgi:hypothetical protein
MTRKMAGVTLLGAPPLPAVRRLLDAPGGAARGMIVA